MDNQNLSHRFWLLIIGLCLAFATGTALIYKFLSSAPYADDGVSAEARAPTAAPRLALFFEPNRGQVAEPVRFLARGTGYSLFLTDTELVTVLRQGGASHDTVRELPARGDPAPYIPADTAPEAAPAQVLRMAFAGANAAPELVGLEPRAGVSNYLRGRDPAGWHSSIPHYGRVRYQGLYDGIDLVLYEERDGADGTGRLQYDFEVAPGADPAVIGWRIDGAVAARIDDSGALRLALADGGEIHQRAPHVYQRVDGREQVIEAAYVLAEPAAGTAQPIQVGFQLAAYDPALPLIIDPVLDYATYLGGSGYDSGQAIAVDGAGRAYVTGYTRSSDFPTTAGALQPEYRGSGDAFVARLDADGSALEYATYLGGSGYDSGQAIAVDSAGRAYVTGYTNSSDFPTTVGALQPAYAGGFSYVGGFLDAFVARLDADGSALEYATYLGGSDTDVGRGIAIDSAGRAYVTGTTYSSNFPTTAGALQPAYAGDGEAFVARLDANGSALEYATYLGGSSSDSGQGIAVDSAGRAYVTGHTDSSNFPTTAGALQPAYAGGLYDAFVARLDADGSALEYATYLGGSDTDVGYGIAIDGAGRAYVAGTTYSSDFPTTAGAPFPDHEGDWEAFVARLDANGSALEYATYLGGSSSGGQGIAVDSAGRAYVTGGSFGFPTTPGALTPAYSLNAFVARLDANGSALEYATYLGGSDDDVGYGIAIDGAGRAYVAGYTYSSDFPTTAGAPFPDYEGGGEAFVARLDLPAGYSITPKTIEVPENAGTIIFTVHRTDTSKDETLYVSTVQNQGFTNQNDYVGLLNQPLFFAVDQSTQQVPPIQIIDDAIPEPDETFGLIVQASPTDPIETFLASATFTILDNDAVVPAPVLSVTPPELNFDPVVAGQASASRNFTVRNTGSGVLSGTCATAPPFYFASAPCAYDLAAAESSAFALYFQPQSEGDFIGMVSFTSNAGSLSWIVTGTTTPQPAIKVSTESGDESLNFDSVVVGQTSTAQSVTVTNTGTADLTVGILTLAGDNPGDYLLSTNPTCNGANLPPQETCSFAVAFQPTAVGTRTASVSIPSNDPISPSKTVSVVGEGVSSIPVVMALSPESGPSGSIVSIQGQDFGKVQGSVWFGAVDAQIRTWADRKIAVTVPSLTPGRYEVMVKVGDRASSTKLFEVTERSDVIELSFLFENGYWVPTTYDEHGGIGTNNAVDFRYANPQESGVFTWVPTSNQPLIPLQNARATHSGLLMLERERFYCSGTDEVVQSTLIITDSTNTFKTWYAHLETLRPLQWVFTHNTVEDSVNLRECPSTDCNIVRVLKNGTMRRVLNGPVLSEDKNLTWWQLWDDTNQDGIVNAAEETGWAVEALGSEGGANGRQVLLNSLLQQQDQVVVVNGSLNLRANPCTAKSDKSCKIETRLKDGTELTIVGGPLRKLESGAWHTWWRVKPQSGESGWVVEAVNDVPTSLSGTVGTSAGTVSTPTLAKRVTAGEILGQVYNYGCSRSGAHLHFAVSQTGKKGFLDLTAKGPVRLNGEAIFAGSSKKVANRTAYGAIPRE